jgi:carbamoyltransferase
MAGGVALNGVANGKLQRSGLFKQIYIQPAAGDAVAGQLVRHWLLIICIIIKKNRTCFYDGMNGAFLGPSFPIGISSASVKIQTNRPSGNRC